MGLAFLKQSRSMDVHFLISVHAPGDRKGLQSSNEVVHILSRLAEVDFGIFAEEFGRTGGKAVVLPDRLGGSVCNGVQCVHKQVCAGYFEAVVEVSRRFVRADRFFARGEDASRINPFIQKKDGAPGFGFAFDNGAVDGCGAAVFG